MKTLAVSAILCLLAPGAFVNMTPEAGTSIDVESKMIDGDSAIVWESTLPSTANPARCYALAQIGPPLVIKGAIRWIDGVAYVCNYCVKAGTTWACTNSIEAPEDE